MGWCGDLEKVEGVAAGRLHINFALEGIGFGFAGVDGEAFGQPIEDAQLIAGITGDAAEMIDDAILFEGVELRPLEAVDDQFDAFFVGQNEPVFNEGLAIAEELFAGPPEAGMGHPLLGDHASGVDALLGQGFGVFGGEEFFVEGAGGDGDGEEVADNRAGFGDRVGGGRVRNYARRFGIGGSGLGPNSAQVKTGKQQSQHQREMRGIHTDCGGMGADQRSDRPRSLCILS